MKLGETGTIEVSQNILFSLSKPPPPKGVCCGAVRVSSIIECVEESTEADCCGGEWHTYEGHPGIGCEVCDRSCCGSPTTYAGECVVVSIAVCTAAEGTSGALGSDCDTDAQGRTGSPCLGACCYNGICDPDTVGGTGVLQYDCYHPMVGDVPGNPQSSADFTIDPWTMGEGTVYACNPDGDPYASPSIPPGCPPLGSCCVTRDSATFAGSNHVEPHQGYAHCIDDVTEKECTTAMNNDVPGVKVIATAIGGGKGLQGRWSEYSSCSSTDMNCLCDCITKTTDATGIISVTIPDGCRVDASGMVHISTSSTTLAIDPVTGAISTVPADFFISPPSFNLVTGQVGASITICFNNSLNYKCSDDPDVANNGCVVDDSEGADIQSYHCCRTGSPASWEINECSGPPCLFRYVCYSSTGCSEGEWIQEEEGNAGFIHTTSNACDSMCYEYYYCDIEEEWDCTDAGECEENTEPPPCGLVGYGGKSNPMGSSLHPDFPPVGEAEFLSDDCPDDCCDDCGYCCAAPDFVASEGYPLGQNSLIFGTSSFVSSSCHGLEDGHSGWMWIANPYERCLCQSSCDPLYGITYSATVCSSAQCNNALNVHSVLYSGHDAPSSGANTSGWLCGGEETIPAAVHYIALCDSGIAPVFGETTSTTDGFTVSITNIDDIKIQVIESDTITFGLSGVATASGSVSIDDETGVVTVTNVADGVSSTATIKIHDTVDTTPYYSVITGRVAPGGGVFVRDVNADITAISLEEALTPEFAEPYPTNDGFYVQITNYDSSYTWAGTAVVDAPFRILDGNISASVDGDGLVTVTGVSAETDSTATITTEKEGSAPGTADIGGKSLAPALIPTFGDTVSTADGFITLITNYDDSYTWTGTATSGIVTISSGGVEGLGFITVTGVANNTASTATITTQKDNSDEGNAQTTATSLAALTPTFGATTRTADGFTVQITNYNANYTWTGEATAQGTATINGNGFVTVTGVAPFTSSVLTIKTDRTVCPDPPFPCVVYPQGSDMITEVSLHAALIPQFGSPTATADGFYVQVTNYDATYTWGSTASLGSATIDGYGLVTVTGVPAAAVSTATITTTKEDSVPGGNYITGLVPLLPALIPDFESITPTADGFTVQISNYDGSFSWSGEATASGSVDVSGSGLVTVTGVAAATSSTATITTTKPNALNGSAQVWTTSLGAALTPTFGSPTPTATGFTVYIGNYNSTYSWGGTATASGSVSISGGGLITVTGVATGTNSTATITTAKTGFNNGSATTTETSLNSSLTPAFGTPTVTAGGFTVQISNYSGSYSWAGTATASGTVAVSGSGLVTVTGVAAATSSTATITTTRVGYVGGTAQITAFPTDALTPAFGTPTSTADGFTVQISNYDSSYTWSGSATASGSVTISGSGLVTVNSVATLTISTATITTVKTGHSNGTATVTETSLDSALTPTFGSPTSTADGFKVQISNYDYSYYWAGTATAGTVTVSGTGLVTVTGVAVGTSSTATITTVRDGYAGGTAEVTATSLLAALNPTFGTKTATADGFTVQISNYDAAYTWNAAGYGAASISGSGLVAVTGVAPGVSSSVTITTTRTGYVEGWSQTTETSLYAALTPAFGTITPKADGFTVMISNYDAAYTWAGTATASGSVSISGTGLATVTGLAADTSSTATITTTRLGYASGSATVTSTSALIPTFGSPTSTNGGFTVQISNYDSSYSWVGTASGSVAINGTGLVTVTGLAADTPSTATITATKNSIVGGSTVTGVSLAAGLTPTFGSTTPTADGFHVQITNYNNSYYWSGTATSGSVAIDGGGLVTITGVAANTSSTATITTVCLSCGSIAQGSVSSNAQVTETSLLAALTPEVGANNSIVRTVDGFTIPITNYDSSYTWSGDATSGAVGITGFTGFLIGEGLITVTGVAPDTYVAATITTTKIGHAIGKITVFSRSLPIAALTPTFGSPTPTADGFTVQISNYDAAYTWTGTASAAGTATISGSGLVTVTGVAPQTPSTVTIVTVRTGYADGIGRVTATSFTVLIPTFGNTTRTADGFTVQISNYDAAYTWAGTATLGSIAVSGTGLATITGVAAGTSSTATITTTRTGYAGGSATVTETSLIVALTPTFGSTTATAQGFTVQISNYNSSYNWTGTATASRSVVVNGTGLVTVTGVAPATSSTATITTTRFGYVSGSATVTETSLAAALTPTFGTPTATADGFTVQINNYNALYTWAGTATASGSVAISGSGLVTVTGVTGLTSSTATITTTRTGYVGGTANVTQTSAVGDALTPTFGSTTATASGFTVQISNYSGSYTWAGTATASGSVAVSGTGLVTVNGVAFNTSSTATITTTRTGYTGGSATVTATSLLGATLTPTFGSTTATADGFTVQISNYSALYTWAGTATASGTVAVSGTGLVTVTGVAANTSSTATITTTRTGYTGGTAQVTQVSMGLAPTFGSPTSTADGFTVQITNYDAAYTWAGTATASGSVAINGTGLVTVSGVAMGTNSTATITTTRTGYVSGSANVTAMSVVIVLNPTFGSTTARYNGFTVQITNYNAAYTWAGTATASGSVAINGTGLVTVYGVAPNTSSTATITTTRTGVAGGTANVTATSLLAGLTPTFNFGSVTNTSDGFTVQITNYNTLYTWAGTAGSGGTVVVTGSGSSGLATVTGLAPGTGSTMIITTTRTGYAAATANIFTYSLNAALTPTFGSTTATATGFTVQITNYSSSYTWAGTATASGTVVVSGTGLVTVTGVAAATSSTATITTTRTGYTGGTNTVTATSLA